MELDDVEDGHNIVICPSEFEGDSTRLQFDSTSFDPLTHYLFRYPAKFHPPALKKLIEQFTRPGQTILDPFCGSGSLLVESAVIGRNAIGTDIDPVAVFISKGKIERFPKGDLKEAVQDLLAILDTLKRSDDEYNIRMFQDITAEDLFHTLDEEELWIPQIPNLFHWFRNYVLVDLARIRQAIMRAPVTPSQRRLFFLCFGAIIRAASNADPVPVSGLEVTSHMKKKDEAGRIINPFRLFEKALTKSVVACETFAEKITPGVRLSAFQADATIVSSYVTEPIDCVITSPPYHNAVDYYRRHQLEMYWLELVLNRDQRLALLDLYIGRPSVPMRHRYVAKQALTSPLAIEWHSRIQSISKRRADAFKHYVIAMTSLFSEIARILPIGSPAIFIVGRSTWNGSELPTGALFEEIASPWFRATQQLWYPVKNRYMSYVRRNGANIDKEFVLVFERSDSRLEKGI